MSVTSGVVSRIEVTSYTHGATALLGMQIDAGVEPLLALITWNLIAVAFHSVKDTGTLVMLHTRLQAWQVACIVMANDLGGIVKRLLM